MKRMSVTVKVLLLIPALFFCLTQAQAAPKEVRMDRALQRKLNTFFSNFSEAELPSFNRGQLSNASMINFGMWHRWINNDKSFQSVPGNNGEIKNTSDPRHYYSRIHAELIESAAQWYFGRSIKRVTTPKYLYRGGFFYGNFGDGDPLPFAQVTKLIDRYRQRRVYGLHQGV